MDMIEIDGSEAGGQLVRTAIALSALTEKPVRIANIRGARTEAGLKVQHMEGIKAIAELSSAEIKGLELGSTFLEFIPQKMEAKDLQINISTAGSIGLVLQILLIATANLKSSVRVEFDGGATWGKWAPPVEYIKRVFLPLLEDKTEIKIIRDGFYPKGGAKVEVKTHPWKQKEMKILEQDKLKRIEIISVASAGLQKGSVAERQSNSAAEVLKEKLGIESKIENRYADTLSTGTGILIVGEGQYRIIGSDALGELKKRAEEVGRDCAKNFVIEYANGAVDRHAADMLLQYMALHESGSILSSEISQHILENIKVIEKFLDVKFRVDGEKGKPGIISLG